MHPPGGVALHLDPRDADLLSDLPRARDAMGIDIELRRLAKSRSRRVAKRMSDRIRATRNVRVASRSRSCPTTYQTPSSSRSAYGLRRRSVSRSRAGDQYRNWIVRCFEIADSSLESRAASSGE